MKEYIRTLKELIRVNKNELILYGVAPLIGSVIGVVMVFVIMFVAGDGEDYGELGSFAAALIGGIALVIGQIFGIQNEFNTAISMGKARKNYMPAKYTLLVIETLMIVFIVSVTGWIEGVLYTAVYPGSICELNASAWLSYPVLVISVILGLPALIMLLGVLLMTFGQKFFWIIWALWMVGFIGGPRMISAVTEEPESIVGRLGILIINFVRNSSTIGMVICTCIVIAAVWLADFILFRRQRVTS